MPEFYNARDVFGPEDDEDLLSLIDRSMAKRGQSASDAPEFDTSALDALVPKAEAIMASKTGGAERPDTYGELDVFAPKEGENAPTPGYKPAGEETGLDALLEQETAHGGPQTPTQQMAGAQPKEASGQVIGDSGNAFGVQDERDDLMSARDRAGQLYDSQAQAGAATGPGEEERRFLELNERPTRQQMKTAWIMGALFGSPEDNMRMQEMLHGRAREYDQGLAAARAADKAARPRRVDRATAELAALSGLSPEAAAAMMENSPAVNLLKAGGINIGKGLRGQDTGVLKENIGQTGDTYRQAVGEEGKNDRAQLAADTQIATAKLRKRDKTPGDGTPGMSTPDAAAAYISKQAAVPFDMAKKYLAGQLDPKSVSSQKLQEMEREKATWNSFDNKKRGQVMASLGGEQDSERHYRVKMKQEANSIAQPLGAAIRAWNSLSKEEKVIAAKVGLGGGAAVFRDMKVDGKTQAKIGAIVEQINAKVKQLGGSAISAGEWQRFGAAMGVTGEGYNPFKAPDGISAWLKRAKQAYDADRGVLEQEYPGIFSTEGQ